MGAILILDLISPWLSIIYLILKGYKINLKNEKASIMYPIIVAIIMGSLGYCCYCEKADLERLAYVLDKLQTKPISFLMNETIQSSIGEFNIWFYLTAKAMDYNLMTGVAAFMMYYVTAKNIAYTSFCLKTKSKVSFIIGFSCFIALQFVQLLPIGRSMTAFSILLLAVYRDLFQNKKDIATVILYILPITLHTGTIVLYLLRLLLPLFSKYTKICVCIGVVSTNLIPIIYEVRRFFPSFIAKYIEKADLFYTGQHAWGIYTLTNIYHRTVKWLYIMTLIIFFIVYIYTMNSKKGKLYLSKKPKGHRMYLCYLLEVATLTVSCFWVKSDVYYRYINMLFFGLPCVLIYAEKCIRKDIYKALVCVFICIAFLIHIAGIWSGILNGKFEFENTLMQNIFFNIPYIIVKDIMEVIR